MRKLLFCLSSRHIGMEKPATPEDVLDILRDGRSLEDRFRGQEAGLQELQEEILDSLNADRCVNIFVDGHASAFDMSGSLLALPDCQFVPRGDIQSVTAARNVLRGNLVPETQNDSVRDWFRFYEPGRAMKEIDFMETFYDKPYHKFIDIIPEWFKDNGKVFLKTISKGSSFTLEASSTPFDCFGYGIESISRQCLLQEFVEIDKDEHGRNEWRFFVIDGKVVSESRCSDIIAEVDFHARLLAEDLAGTFRFACIDVFSHSGGIIELLECNDICSSGRYLGNRPQDLRIALQQEDMPCMPFP